MIKIDPKGYYLEPYRTLQGKQEQEDAEAGKIGEEIWRHTIGRVSSLARTPIYLFGTFAQTGKIFVKMVVACLTLGQLHRLNFHKFTFDAVARDSIFLLSMLEKVGGSAIHFLAAPPKKYKSFAEAFKKSMSIVFLDDYHTEGKYKYIKKAVSVSKMWEKYLKNNKS